MIKHDLPLRNILLYFSIGIFSAIIFCTIYGIKILNPTYTDWLLCEGEDLAQHYLGWVAYRNSAWHFPLGMTDTLMYPHQSSIIFTDSIPLMAIFFKLLSPALPSDFQYFGLWGILCFVLQGILTARIIRNYTNDTASVILTSIIFLYTPVMLSRMYQHTALAGQWILLLGLEPLFARKKYENTKKIYVVTALMGVLSSSIHIYFVLMSGIILVGICLADIIAHKRVLRSILLMLEYIFAAAFVVWMLGGFADGNHVTADGLGTYSFNLNSFVNPMGWSCIFKELPLVYTDRQQEGFAWLGAGFIFLLPLSMILSWIVASQSGFVKKNVATLIPLCIAVGISIVVALSPTITLGSKVLLRIRLPIWVSNIWGMFRSTGRIVWVSVYIIMLCICVTVSKTVKKRTFVILMVFCLLLQIYDSHEYIESTAKRYASHRTYERALGEKGLWSWAATNTDIRHIVYCSAREGDSLYRLTNWALKHNKTMNTFYFARSNDLTEVSTAESLYDPSPDELFVFSGEDRYLCVDMNYDLHYYVADGLVIAYVHEIDGFEELPDNRSTICYRDQNQFVSSFVERLFSQFLGRTAQETEIEEYCRMILKREMDMQNIMFRFVYAEEFQKRDCTDEEFIKIIYEVLLNRDCDPSGLNYWIEKITQGMSREELIQSIIGSEEFHMRMVEGGGMPGWISHTPYSSINLWNSSLLAKP